MRWFERYLPAEGVQVANITDQWMGLAVIGPKSQQVLQELTRYDLASLPFLGMAEMNIGLAPARVDRVSLTGELGYEVWMPASYMRHVYTRLLDAGADLGIGNVGILALLSMRLEKGFGIWGREFSPDYSPSQNDMANFVNYDKPGFVGRDSALADRDQGPTQKLVMLSVAATTSDATGFEPVYLDDQVVGFVTSGGFGHRTEQSLALAYVNVDALDPETQYEIPLIGVRHGARLLSEIPFDPTGSRMRG